jgi:hypothetical protein
MPELKLDKWYFVEIKFVSEQKEMHSIINPNEDYFSVYLLPAMAL